MENSVIKEALLKLRLSEKINFQEKAKKIVEEKTFDNLLDALEPLVRSTKEKIDEINKELDKFPEPVFCSDDIPF